MQMSQDLDIQYEILSKWTANPDCVITSRSIILNRKTEPFLQPILDRGETPMTFLMPILRLCGDGLLESRRNEDGTREYSLAPCVHDFVKGIERHGGWQEVKAKAEGRPVRMTMDNIARWVLSLPE